MATDKLGLTSDETGNWKPKALMIGALVGAAVGIGAAYLFIQQAEREGSTPSISAGEGVKLGLLVLGLLRSVAVLGEGDK